ncbi:MAG: aconitate hydratase [Bacteroidales bacterium]|nr:aconitate hydratase [Bacteroidales bacterium]
MAYDLNMLEQHYATLPLRMRKVREILGHPLTLSEKILYSHLYVPDFASGFRRGIDYVSFRPDRVAMQDATAQMALLQFMNAERDKVAVPSTIHCDHLILADNGAGVDLPVAEKSNEEVYSFLRGVADKYGIGFWKPGAGIIHQVILENYAFPGGFMVGTDSHTPNAGGLSMIAIGVGGADAVDVMTDMPWELKMPKIIGVKLTGHLYGWATPKDVILRLAGLITVKGATNSIIEYFGEGVDSISATGRATICNMGAEVGATTSIFPLGKHTLDYLYETGRSEVAEMACKCVDCLCADSEVIANPEKYYDQLIEINLSSLEPYLNGPFTPDAAHPVSSMAADVDKYGYPEKVEAGLIGSCTNSSYQDLSRAASLARQAVAKHLKVQTPLYINPGSEQIRYTAERDGIIADFERVGAVVMANACGPCIGQWRRHTDDNTRKNTIVTSFNRNFAKRADGNPNTYAFVSSPEMVMALAIAGKLTFNPLTDSLLNMNGEKVKLDPPEGDVYPPQKFEVKDNGYCPATGDTKTILINPSSQRLQKLEPFKKWDGKDFIKLPLLIQTKGKCTTDHISMAGPWLRFRGHLENISQNLLMGAVNRFNGKTNSTLNQLLGVYAPVSEVAKYYKDKGISSIVVAEENYGEGSSREHAAMEPRFLNVKVVLAKSFARIHETNLKKQGILTLTFVDKCDYDKVREDDKISIIGLGGFVPDSLLTVVLNHKDGSSDQFKVRHTYSVQQIEWFKAGSALNIKK